MKKIFLFLIIVLPLISFAQIRDTVIVHFRFNKYELDKSEQHKIDSAMRGKNIYYIEINAHTDSVGSNEYNQVLSDQRGMAVANYISSSRRVDSMAQRASGETQPLNANATAAERALNRRAEIILHRKLPPLDDIYVKGTTDTTAKGLPMVTGAEAQQEMSRVSTDNSKPKEHEEPRDSFASALDKYGQKTFTADKIDSATEGSILVLPNMNFYGGRHKMYPEGEKTLEELLEAMRNHPKLVIEIDGHVCCEYNGQDGYDFDAGNRNLSVNRARMVYDYLVRNGIPESRLSYKGFGSKHKITKERDEYEQMLNRRVEIKIIKK